MFWDTGRNEAVGFHPIGINGCPFHVLVQSMEPCKTGCGLNSGKKTMMNILNKLKGNKSGASAAEYALIVAVLGGFVVAGSVAFGGSLKTAMSASGAQLVSEQGKAR